MKNTLEDFLAVIGLYLDLDQKRSGTPHTIANQTDVGIGLQRKCCTTSQDPVIRYSVVPVPWRERGQLRSKGGGRTTIHFNGSTQNIELLLQMVISVNQLSLNGAVADLIEELPDDQRSPRKSVALDQIVKYKPMKIDRETYCKITSEDLKQTTRRPEVIQIVSPKQV